ncbi:hypothetical protein AYI69_g10088, partial [Smittium culicis]
MATFQPRQFDFFKKNSLENLPNILQEINQNNESAILEVWNLAALPLNFIKSEIISPERILIRKVPITRPNNSPFP